MLLRAFITIALICAIPSAYSYSSGAPEQACGDMIPQHHVEPQKSDAPYKFILNEHQYKAGQSVNFEIKGNAAGDTIKGFLIQARIGDKPVGKFEIPMKSKKYAQLLNCSGGSGNALTHKKIFGSGQNSIIGTWLPPQDVSGEVKLIATIALNGGVYWVQKVVTTITIS
ncbi:putative defense protein Hdd11 [Contarinia nasturtii]|uniref:putative defense protein Hdd11 n=1 Tax=Contarinia nasturtii TaxID=265458 RepID=UPI0012D3EA88|nr:putative defense protein Hdd11 [Contarinia nasturtii]